MITTKETEMYGQLQTNFSMSPSQFILEHGCEHDSMTFNSFTFSITELFSKKKKVEEHARGSICVQLTKKKHVSMINVQ